MLPFQFYAASKSVYGRWQSKQGRPLKFRETWAVCLPASKDIAGDIAGSALLKAGQWADKVGLELLMGPANLGIQ